MAACRHRVGGADGVAGPMRIRRSLGSPRLAALLIASLLLLSLVSVIVPQTPTLGSEVVTAWRETQPWLAEPAIALGLHRVFYSWPCYIVSLLLALNLAVCTFDRSRSRRSASEGRSLGPEPEDAVHVVVASGTDPLADLARGMRGFAVQSVDGGAVCRSGRWGFAGSVIMHAGLIVLIVAGVVTGLTRFEGVMLLTEGLGAEDVPASYVELARVPDVGQSFTGAHITLDRMEFDYEGPTITESRAFLSVRRGDGQLDYTARVNHPLRVGAKSFLLKDSGLAVGLRVTDPSGTVLPDSMVNLGRMRTDGYADSADFGGLHLGLLAVPDAAAPRGANVARKLDVVDPAVVVSATVDGVSVESDAFVRPGEALEAAGWRIDVLEVRRWTSFNARVDRGMYVAYLGFALAVLGCAARVLDPDRTVRVQLSGQRAAIWARARWGRAMAVAATDRAARALSSARDGRVDA